MSKIKLSKRGLKEDSQEGKEVNISKATYNDKIRWLHEAVDKIEYHYKDKWGDICRCYCWLRDHDDDYVYIHIKDATYRMPYTLENNKVDIDTSNPVEVVSETTYTVVGVDESDESDEDSMVEKILKGITKHFGGTQKEGNPIETSKELMVIKKFEDEEMIVYEPLYTPPDTPDLVGESMSQETITKMVGDIKKKIEAGTMQANLFHKVPTDSFKWIDCFENPWPICMVGEQEVVKGQPVIVAKYSNAKAYEARKAGLLKGPSIGFRGKRRDVG